MACGCKNAANNIRSKAMLCAVCEHRQGGYVNMTCSAKGKSVRVLIQDPGESCEFWPGADGVVHRYDQAWLGVPPPVVLRVAIMNFVQTFRDWYSPGCGCHAGLKRFWNWINSR